MLANEEKNNLAKIGFFLIIILSVVVISYTNSYIRDKRVASKIIIKQSEATIKNKKIDALIKNLNLPEGYGIEVFSNGYKNPTAFATGPFNGILLIDSEVGGIYQLVDNTQDHVADFKHIVIENLDALTGIDYSDNSLYVSLRDGVYRYDYAPLPALASDRRHLLSLPNLGGHEIRSININDEKIYTTVGVLCEDCQNSDFRASLLSVDKFGRSPEIFATGLANTFYFDFDKDGNIWGNESGWSGKELNVIDKGKHYGRIDCDNKDDELACIGGEAPIYEYTAHSEPSGIAVINSPEFPAEWQGDAFVALHGSLVNGESVGYKVVRLDIEGNQVVQEEDFITGWVKEGKVTSVLGRPIFVGFNSSGSLFIVDDQNGAVYKIFKKIN